MRTTDDVTLAAAYVALMRATQDRLSDSLPGIDEVHEEQVGEYAMHHAELAKHQHTPPAEVRRAHVPRQRRFGGPVSDVGSRFLALLAIVKARIDHKRLDGLAAKLGEDRVRAGTPDRSAQVVTHQRTPPAEIGPTRVPRLRRVGRRIRNVGLRLLELLAELSPF